MTRILIINDYSIKNNDAVGITLRNLFLESGSDFEVMEIFKKSKTNQVPLEVKSLKVSPKVMPIYSFFNYLKAKKNKGIASEKLSTVNNSSNIKSKIKDYIMFYSEYIMFIDNREIKKIRNFNPEYIYTVGGSVFSLKYSLNISKKLNIPLVIHYMDNWKETLFNGSKILNKKLNYLVTLIDRQASSIISISDKMRKSYTKKNNASKMYVLMNPVNPFIKEIDNNENIKGKKNISFIGGVHLNRWEELLDIASIIKKNNLENKVNILIYSNSPRTKEFNKLFENNVIIDCGNLPHEELYKAYQKSDVLLHVESFNKTVMQYTKFSMSTKIPEYMAIQKPILYYGPANIAVGEYISEHKVGLVSSNEVELLDALEIIIEQKNELDLYIENGKKVVENQYSIEHAQEILSAIFK
ncbi:hypothetical protein [Vagococcus fluvialis]|uniref:hypothetical protein n=1 Tax=Vagococcus fluvialis TaxID=2738 RepID=UPI003B5AA80B